MHTTTPLRGAFTDAELARAEPEARFLLDLHRARDPRTGPRALRALARHNRFEVLRAVAGHPRAPARLAFRLGARFPEVLLRTPRFVALLLHPGRTRVVPAHALRSVLRLDPLPRSLAIALAHDPRPSVRVALAERLAAIAEGARAPRPSLGVLADEGVQREWTSWFTPLTAAHAGALRRRFRLGRAAGEAPWPERAAEPRERIRCLEADKVRRLRHPGRARVLRSFVADE